MKFNYLYKRIPIEENVKKMTGTIRILYVILNTTLQVE